MNGEPLGVDVQEEQRAVGSADDADGQPGRDLVAVSDDNTASLLSFDSEMLEELKARAASVTVRTGEKSRVGVKMRPASER